MTSDKGLIVVLVLLLSSLAVVTSAQEAQSLLPLSATQTQISRLAPSVTHIEASFLLDEAQTVRFESIASASGITTSVLGPHGETVNSSTITSLGGQFVAFEGGPAASSLLLPTNTPGFHTIFKFPFLGIGQYRVVLQAPATLSQEVAVISQVETDSKIGAAFLLPREVITVGHPVVLTVPFFNGATAMRDATVKVTILPPSGTPTEVTLLDDGGAVDDRAGDGLYSGQFTPSAPGEYQAAASIQSSGGTPMIRQAGAEFKAVALSARLSGAVSDHGVDDNANGLFDRIVVDVGADVTQAGDYQAFVELVTAGGKRLRRSAQAALQAGSDGISVSFEAAALRALGENGPFKIEPIDLVLLSSEGAIDADSRADAGMTGLYTLSQLEQPLLALSGTSSDQGIDEDGNGLFDKLRVRIGVDVAVNGIYSWSLKLSDASLRELDFAAGSGFLETGANMLEVVFSGPAIGRSGANGPYRLRDLLISGPASLVQVDAGGTQSYRADQFEGFSGSACTPGPTATCLNGGRFKVEVVWHDFQGGQGNGQLVPFGSGDSGLFWFFDPANWEMLVKVLDGCALNGNFWVFAAATTSVGYTLQVTDTQTGIARTYSNPLGQSSPALTDTGAFPTCATRTASPAALAEAVHGETTATPSAKSSPASGAKATCAPGAGQLCLSDSRFRVTVDWQDFQGNRGSAQVVPFGSADSGLFWFFDAQNWEMLVKVLDGCSLNRHFWVFSAATTNVEYTLHVLDTQTGVTKDYHNPLGRSADAVTDTGAFATCP